jgi:hypothetical protein
MSMSLLINGQFMRQTPFSLLVLPSFAWRTEARKGGCDEYVTPAGLNLLIQVADDFGGDDP